MSMLLIINNIIFTKQEDVDFSQRKSTFVAALTKVFRCVSRKFVLQEFLRAAAGISESPISV